MTENMEAIAFRLSRESPTGQVIHDEIGVSWEVIARAVYFCSRNEVEKYAKYLPREFYTAKQGEAVKVTMDIWDEAIHKYQESLRCQKQRQINVKEKWEKERPKYERALNLRLRFGRLTDDELAYIREQTKENDYTPAYDGEYDILDVEYDEIAFNNKQKLLKQMKPIVAGLSIEVTKKLTAFYDGYTAFAYTPLIACISIMTESAKQQLKEAIDSINADTKNQFQRAIYHSKALLDCAGICQNNSEKLRGGQKTVWNSFEEKTKGALYLHALRMAALVLVFHIWEWSNSDLEILMEYSFCLSDNKQREILQMAEKLVSSEKIRSRHTLEEIKPFIAETMTEEEALERYFELEIANQVYD